MVSPTAFDHLVHLKQFEISLGYSHLHSNLHNNQKFETAAPALRRFTCTSVTSVKFNTKETNHIEEMTLNGSETQIETFSEQQPMNNLKRLLLNSLRADFPFHIMTNLEYLEIKKLKDLSFSSCITPFHCLSKLKVLKFDTLRMENKINIERLESGQWFSGLASLTHLVINNRIRDVSQYWFELIEPGTFVHLPNLKHLDLSDNRLTSFPFACLTNELAKLEYLSLCNNEIASLDGLGDTGSSLSSRPSRLRVLDLESNQMSIVLPCRAFSNVPSLEKLLFNYNNIEVIETGAFEGLGNLRHLKLSFNRLKTFDFGAIFFEDGKFGSHGLKPVNLQLLELYNTCAISFQAPETFKAKCCFRDPVDVEVNPCQSEDSSELDKLIERGVILIHGW
jgi:Leucine-rich repeat (LRR) protein